MSVNLCKYKYIFGKPREGSHSYRIPVVDLAFVDVFLTILASVAIGSYFKYNIFVVFIMLMIVAIVLHKAFCVETTINKFIFN